MRTTPFASSRVAGKNPAIRGSALIIVIMLCAFTLFLVASYLRALSNTSRISYRSTLQNEGRNAAEGVSEYVLAEMHRRSQANPSFGAGANPNPLSGFSLSSDNISFIAPGTGYSRIVPGSIAFKNSVLSNAPSAPQAIDPTDPVNAQDPSIDQTPLSIRSMNIFAKAAALDPQTNQQVKSFISTNVQIRDQTWFNYAIFYNMDLEFHAGPNFTVFGPVHTNATAYMTAGDGNKLQFFSTLSAVGKLNRFDKYTGNTSGGHGGTVESSSKTGMLVADLKSMATNRDSNYSLFHDYATTRWNSFVQDSSFSVPKFNPPGMKEYVPENYSTGTVELRNNGYLMIEPQLSMVSSHTDPYTGINDYGYKGLDSENLKFSALSGFIIQVKPPASVGAAPQWQLVCYQATDTTKRLSADNPPARDSVTGLPIIACIINPFTDKDDLDYPAPSTQAVIKRTLKVDLLNAIVSIPYRDGGTSGTVWGNGTSNLTAYTQAKPAGTAEGPSPTFTQQLAGTHYPIYDRREGHSYTTGGGDVWPAMRGAMHVIKIDFAKLNTLLNDTSGKWLRPYGSTSYVYNPAASYTGVVYVQFPLAPIDTSRFPSPVGSTTDGDMIRPAQRANPSATAKPPGYAVLARNAGVVPQMASGSEPPDGFTIATNGLFYVWGHFNADGNSSTGSSILPDNTSERPALIAADAVTVLSANPSYAFASTYNTKHTATAFTEVSAAILTGIIPTRPGTDLIWSGGVHNLVRLLENWTGDYRFRGSLGVLFENEVAQGKYHEGHNPYYDPPDRDMGYHQYLSQGRFPPATPIKRTVRRMNLQDITEAEYNAGPTKPPAFN